MPIQVQMLCQSQYITLIVLLPQNATITSVSCVAAGSTYSGSTYFTTRVFQLYNGNTAKGTATTITGNGSTKATHNINGGSWTRSELDNIKIVEYVKRGTSQTSTQASFSFWGATLTVEYTYETVTYNVTSTLATDKVDSIDPEGVTESIGTKGKVKYQKHINRTWHIHINQWQF